jgi:hypothetical protein
MDWVTNIFSIAALVIAIISLYISLQTRKLNSSSTLSDAYNKINTLALSDDKNLVVLDRLYFPELVDQDIEEKRKRWATFISLNAIEHTFIANRYKAIDPHVATPILDNLLKTLLQSKEVQDTLDLGYWDTKFTKHAKKIIAESHNNAN